MKKILTILIALLITSAIYAQDETSATLLDTSLTEAQVEEYHNIAVRLDNERLKQEVQAWKVLAVSDGGATVSHTSGAEEKGGIFKEKPKTAWGSTIGIIAALVIANHNEKWIGGGKGGRHSDGGGGSESSKSENNGDQSGNTAGGDQTFFIIDGDYVGDDSSGE